MLPSQLGFVLGRQLKNLDILLDRKFKRWLLAEYLRAMYIQKEGREELSRGAGTTHVLYGSSD